jgi:hypothetical protein
VSAFVDSTGKVYQHSPSVDPDETPQIGPATLLDDVAVQTPFKVYATLGEWFGAVCLIITCVLGLAARAKSQRPAQWRLVAAGAATLGGGLLLATTLFCGPRQLGLAMQLLAHYPVAVTPEESFRIGVRLLPAVALACLGCGAFVAWLARRSDRAPRLEVALAVLAIVVLPATLVGALEGEQAALVISALVAIAMALAALRVTRRRLAR